VLFNSGIPAHAYWYWIGLAALVGYVFLFYTLYTLALTYLNRKFNPFTKSSKLLNFKIVMLCRIYLPTTTTDYVFC
jgi:hypothetical protein